MDTPMKVAVSVVALIGLGYWIETQVREVTGLDRVWPPPVTPDTLAFRRAANRLHEVVVADAGRPRDLTGQRQAESVYRALEEVRIELEERAGYAWSEWLVMGRHSDFLPGVIMGGAPGTAALEVASVIALAGEDRLGRRPVLVPALFLVVTAGVASGGLALCFRNDRRHFRRLADELRDWGRRLHPGVFRR